MSDDIKDKIIFIIDKIMCILYVIVIYYFYWEHDLAEFLAGRYARNQTHIQDSCLYFSHFATSKYGHEITHVTIDDSKIRDLDYFSISDTPFAKKMHTDSWEEFLNKVDTQGGGVCHKIKSIKVELIFDTHYFVYDYY